MVLGSSLCFATFFLVLDHFGVRFGLLLCRFGLFR